MQLDLPLIESLHQSNDSHLEVAYAMVTEALGGGRVLVVGIAFKAGTDDLRESPSLELVRRLAASGAELQVFDSWVSLDRVVGSNRRYLESRIEGLERLMTSSLAEAVSSTDVVVVAQADSDTATQLAGLISPDQEVVNLCGALHHLRGTRNYRGIAW